MKIYKCVEITDHKEMLEEIVNLDQPIFIYVHSDFLDTFLVTDKEVESPDEEIEKLIKEDYINSDEEPIFDDYEEEDWWLFF